MTEPEQTTKFSGDEIDLRSVFITLWRDRLKIIAISSIFAVASIVYALSLSNEYRATTVVVATSQSGTGNSTTNFLSTQFGDLASIAGVGINPGGGKSNESIIAIEIMQSWGFIDKFIKDHNLAVEIFAAYDWNQKNNELSIDGDVYDIKQEKWIITNGKTKKPTSWELFEIFSKRFSLAQDNKTGLVNVSIEYYSPEIAKQWVELIVASINEHMRQRKLQQVNSNIQYLQEQIEKTSIAEMKEVFYKIIEEQTKSKMLAEASPEYAFETVNIAMMPEKKSKPTRSGIVIAITLLGGLLGVFFSLTRSFLGRGV